MNKEEASKPTISVVIPCLNEAEGLRVLLPQVCEVADEIVVVDNNSTDDTADVARSLGAQVVYEGKEGYGWAYQRGITAATGQFIVTMDGDGTYPAGVIPEVITYIQKRGFDFINCTRFPLTNLRAMAGKNYFANRFTNRLTRWIFSCELMDSQSGMWAFRRKIMEKVLPKSGGMEFSLEIKLNAIMNEEIKFGEYHIDYGKRIGGISKYRPLKDSIHIIATFGRLWKQALKKKKG